MPFQIDTLLLKSFIAIAETGSFSQAADTVGRTQSAVSLQVKKLEEGLNCSLFDRSSRHVAALQRKFRSENAQHYRSVVDQNRRWSRRAFCKGTDAETQRNSGN